MIFYCVYSFLLLDINHRRAYCSTTNDRWQTTNTDKEKRENEHQRFLLFYRTARYDRHIHNIYIIHTTTYIWCDLLVYVCIFSISATHEFWLVDSVRNTGKLASPIFFGLYTIYHKRIQTHARTHQNTKIHARIHLTIIVFIFGWYLIWYSTSLEPTDSNKSLRNDCNDYINII